MILTPITPEPSTGHVTLPAETGQEANVIDLVKRWGADAIRDSDGTELSQALLELGLEVYSTICLVRCDQKWPRANPEQLPRKFLLSEPVTALGTTVVLPLLDGFHPEKYAVDWEYDPPANWQVHDRTTGELVPAAAWRGDPAAGTVTVTGASPYHVYTVSFLVSVIWDTTSMYNHLVNDWDRPHVISSDPYSRETWDHLLAVFEEWLDEHPRTGVVRLTSLAYHFNVDFDPRGQDKCRDWVGYQETLSPPALGDFEHEYGYRLTAEDFVDGGRYNATVRVPSERYLDWMAFIHRFVIRFGRALVERCNAAGKRTAVFHGDHWIGLEPFSASCDDTGIDIHVGAAEDGVALRRVSDIPGPTVKELRLYPYFFPDVFCEEGDPLRESLSNWIKIRRALMRRPVDRIGYGGYLSLAVKFPEFVAHVEELCNEFRAFRSQTDNTSSYKHPAKVAVLNSWGQWRSWINSFGREQKFLEKRQDVVQVAGTNLLECLAGLPVEVQFISFRDVRADGIPDDVDVIINDGDPETAWSGGRNWADPEIATAVRAFVARGGGFIGCRGPTAFPYQGRYFQLADVLGVDQETSQNLQNAALPFQVDPDHFIMADVSSRDRADDESFVYITHRDTRVLRANQGHVLLACNRFGDGRSVFLHALPYSLENSRLLLRSILWVSGQEDALNAWHCRNLRTDCAFYPERNRLCAVNNAAEAQTTKLTDGSGAETQLALTPYESRWFEIRA